MTPEQAAIQTLKLMEIQVWITGLAIFLGPLAGVLFTLWFQGRKEKSAYFSDRGRPNQSDRGRCFSVIVDGLGRHASPMVNVAQSSTISRNWPVGASALPPVLGLD